MMKTPLSYQLTEFDCAPTTLNNAIRFLFDRDEIPPEIIRNIMLYCLDCYGAGGESGKMGTSRTAMMFISNWLDGYGKTGALPISSRYLSGAQVNAKPDGLLTDAVKRGGVAVVRLWYEVEHYALITGISGQNFFMFDPYYNDSDISDKYVKTVANSPFSHNRIVSPVCFEREAPELYSMGSKKDREAVLIFNDKTKKTDSGTIEYFI